METIVGIPGLSMDIFQKDYKGVRSNFPEIRELTGYRAAIDDTEFPTFETLPPFIYPDNNTLDARQMFRSDILLRVRATISLSHDLGLNLSINLISLPGGSCDDFRSQLPQCEERRHDFEGK